MTDHDIQKSKHFLKTLDEEMMFLSNLIAQINSLSSQVIFISSNLRGSWNLLDAIHKNWENKENEKDRP